jgi:hypothetical protein
MNDATTSDNFIPFKEEPMSKKHLIWIIFAIFLLLTATGCVPECTESEMDTKYLSNMNPHSGAIVSSLTPTLEWGWYWDYCNPYQFKITVTNAVTGSESAHSVSGTARDYTLSTPLEAGAKYNWSIYGVTSDGYPCRSSERDFYTGPLCSNITPIAPVLDYPADGEFVSPHSKNLHLTVQWHYTEYCLPHTYVYEFATDPDFINIIASGETSDHKQSLTETFPDCSTIYWHIAAKNGNLQGPFSETRSFNFIFDPKCWMNHYPSDDVALIRGRVYLDYCQSTGLSTVTALCTQHPQHGVIGDGIMQYDEIYNSGPEKGISGIVVDLGTGPCPSTGLDQDTTGANGKFGFTVITPGDYCLSVNKNQTGVSWGNTYNLVYGIWTEPLTTSAIAQYDISLGDGYYDLKYYFGWDKYDGFVRPTFKEKIWCRRIPFHWCDPLHLFEEFDAAPMLARNEEGTWIRSSYQGEVCYFYNPIQTEEEMVPYSLGMPKDEYLQRFEELEVFDPPLPCPTPTPTPRPKPERSPVDPCVGKGERGCIADPACKWVPSAVGPGYCASK